MFYKLTNDVSQLYTDGMYMYLNWNICVVYPIGLLDIAISLLCNYFKMEAALQKHVVNFNYEL